MASLNDLKRLILQAYPLGSPGFLPLMWLQIAAGIFPEFLGNWAIGTPYNKGAIVVSAGQTFISLSNVNLGHVPTPNTGDGFWAIFPTAGIPFNVSPTGPVRITTAALAAVAIAAFALPTDGAIHLQPVIIARAKTAAYAGGAVGDTVRFTPNLLFSTVGGVATQQLAILLGPPTGAAALITAIGATTITVAQVGATLEVRVPGLAVDTIDWEMALQSGSVVLAQS